MTVDPFEKFYSRYPVNLPEAAIVYRELPDKLVRAACQQALSQATTSTLSVTGRKISEAVRPGTLASPSFNLRSASRDFVVGTAVNLMREHDHRIVRVTGEVFGFAMGVHTALQLLATTNVIGASAVLAYEIYSVTDTFLEWQDQREKLKLMKDHDLILLHWGDIARRNRKEMTKLCEDLTTQAKNQTGFASHVAERARLALTGSANHDLSGRDRQNLRGVHAIARKSAISGLTNSAKEANEYLELAVSLKLFFERAASVPWDNTHLGAPPDYKGLIDDNRDRLFTMYGTWFRDFEMRLSRLKRDFENLAALYAWLEPSNPEAQ